MTLEPKIMQAVEQLNYRVTVGDVATHTGLDVNFAQQGLLALASTANGNLQVSESGDVVYLFPRSFRAILRNKFLRLRLQEGWQKVWGGLFYLIRISFGVFLIVSIVLIVLAITIILMSGNRSSGRGRSSYGSSGLLQSLMIRNAFFYFFAGNPYGSRGRRRSPPQTTASNEMNFFEAIFSFLFGDGNPNANLEDRRWALIGTVIRNHQGAIAAEQVAPYLDLDHPDRDQDEDYILPVLVRFQGRPEVSPGGQIIYHFPELQTTATASTTQSVPDALIEQPWKFSRATSSQVMLAIGLGAVNLIGALMLQAMLGDGAIAQELGGLVAFVESIFWLLLAYGIGFLGVPLIRYYWIQYQNKRIERRNRKRQAFALRLKRLNDDLQQKLRYAQKFASQSVVTPENLAYTTEKDLLEQEFERQDEIDAEWQRRLNQDKP